MNRYTLEAKINARDKVKLGYFLEDLAESMWDSEDKESEILDSVKHYCGLELTSLGEVSDLLYEDITDMFDAQTLALAVAIPLEIDYA